MKMVVEKEEEEEEEGEILSSQKQTREERKRDSNAPSVLFNVINATHRFCILP